MGRTRLENFTDGILAVAMTLMVFEIAAPVGAGYGDLWALRYKFVIYGLIFFTLAIYWRNHHHIFSGGRQINTSVMRINILLLFVLTLFPFITAWVGLGSNVYEFVPQMTFGIVLLVANLVFIWLDRAVAKANSAEPIFSNRRIALALIVNLIALGACFFFPPSVLVGRFIELFIWSVPPRKHRIKDEAQPE